MKRALIGVAAGLFSFLAGLIGMYFAMPHVAPHVVEDTRAWLDSVTTVIRPPEAVLTDSSAWSDSLFAVADPVSSAGEAAVSYEDSVQVLRERLRRLEQANLALLADGDKLREELRAVQARRAEAESLSAVLSKLEDKQLTAILNDISIGVLEILYSEASPRNQTKLMQSMSPQRAARFVHTLMKSETESVASTEDARESTEQ